MSRLIQDVLAYQTDKRYAEISKPKFLSMQGDYCKPTPYSVGYEISVTLKQSVIVSEQDKDKLALITSKVREEFSEYVFGEFRPLLNEIIEAALDCPYSETRDTLFEIVDKLKFKMFREGV